MLLEENLHPWHRPLQIVLMMLLAAPLWGGIRLEWDANSETDLAGYKIYWGTASRGYGSPTPMPGAPSLPTYSVKSLTLGTRYYFAVTAYNASGIESEFSNEVSAIVGDVNLDNAINIVDVQSIVNSILASTNHVSHDLNDDGSVNVADLQLEVNLVLSGR